MISNVEKPKIPCCGRTLLVLLVYFYIYFLKRGHKKDFYLVTSQRAFPMNGLIVCFLNSGQSFMPLFVGC